MRHRLLGFLPLRMSPFGTTRKNEFRRLMSACPRFADSQRSMSHFAEVPKGDISTGSNASEMAKRWPMRRREFITGLGGAVAV